MEYIDVTIRESVYLKNGMTEEKVLRFLPYYVKYMLFPEVKAIEICFLDNLKHDLLSYNEEFCISAHEIVKNRFSMVAVIHPDLVDISGWDSEVIKLFKTVRFMINAPINKHCIEIIRYLKSLGVEISLNIIYISNKDENFIRNCVEIANAENVDYFFLADSNGSCFQKDIIDHRQVFSIAFGFTSLLDKGLPVFRINKITVTVKIYGKDTQPCQIFPDLA